MGIFNDNSQNDHYGHIKVVERGPPGPAGTGFELTDKGNYDIDGKRLTDVSKPVDGTDAATKAYVDEKTSHNTSNLYHLRQSFEFYDSSGTKLALNTDNITGLLSDYKYGYYKIAKGGDEITYSYVLLKIKNNLPQSTYSALFHMYGYKNNKIITGLDLGPILYVSDPENYHILKFDDDDSLDTRHDTKGIIWFTADGNGSFNIELRFWDKSITHFVVLSRCVEGEVNLGFRIDIFNVPHNSSSTFYFEDINMNGRKIKIVGDPTDDGDGTNKKYVDTANSKQDIAIADKANKSYVDGEIAKVNIDTTPLLPRNGSRSMFGDLDMDGNHILSVENLVDYKDVDPYEYRVKDLKSVVNKEYLNENFLKKVDKDGREYYDLKQIVIKNSTPHDDGSYDNDTLVSKAFVDAEISKLPKPDTNVLKLDGSKAMTGALDMNNNEIKNLKYPQPSDASYAASVDFVNNTIAGNNTVISNIIDTRLRESEEGSIQSVQQENIFKKVMTDNLFKEDDRIEFLSTINYNLLHRINHLTYLFRIKKDPPESYNGRLSIDLRYLPTGTYTMVFEMKFFPQIDHDKVSVNATSSSLNQVSTKTRVIKFDYGYSRSIINFNKSFTNPGIDDLDIDLHLSLKDTVSPKPDKTSINVIVYGVKGTHSDIPIQTWDKLYDINNGTLKFEIPINMNGKAITNLKDPQPSDASYAASVNFVNKTVNGSNVIINGIIDNKIQESEERSIQATQQENAFKKVMDDDLFIIEDDDIVSFGIVEKDFHRVNQKTHEFKISYDSSIGYYSTRLGISVVYLPISYYTIVFEMYFSDKIDSNNITINANSGTLSVNKINTKISSNHTRSVINFYKAIIHHSDDELEIDMALKNKSGESYENNTNIFVVVYGVYGTQNDVNVELWDRYIYINNKKINFEAPIDMVNKDIENVNDLSINNELNMNNRPIKNVGDGNENSDAVNVKQLNQVENNINNNSNSIKKNEDLIGFLYRNLIKNDSKFLLITHLYFLDSIEGRTQNNYTYQTQTSNNSKNTFYLTFEHKTSTNDAMIIKIGWPKSLNFLITKDRIIISENLLIDEPHIYTTTIPNILKGKQLLFWMKFDTKVNFHSIKIDICGTPNSINVNIPYNPGSLPYISKIHVSDSPFTIKRGLITKNYYDNNSNAYNDVLDYERSEGTFVDTS